MIAHRCVSEKGGPDKVHLRWEITESQPPGGDPPQNGRRCSCQAIKEEARQRATELGPVITELKAKGLSLARMAVELNKRKVATPRGGKWDHSSVGNVLQRLAPRSGSSNRRILASSLE